MHGKCERTNLGRVCVLILAMSRSKLQRESLPSKLSTSRERSVMTGIVVEESPRQTVGVNMCKEASLRRRGRDLQTRLPQQSNPTLELIAKNVRHPRF